MRSGLWVVTSLIAVTVFLMTSCSGQDIKPLTDSEKSKLVETALNTPEALRYLENEGEYEIEVRWVALGWNGSKVVEWHLLDYEEIADGNLPSRKYVSERVTIHPEVNIRVGEPVRMFVSVAFDRDTQEVVHVELQPSLSR